MAKVKYYAKENSSIGTHSFYAVPIPNGTLTFDELLEEAMDGKSVEPSIAKACVTEFMKAVKRSHLPHRWQPQTAIPCQPTHIARQDSLLPRHRGASTQLSAHRFRRIF